MIFYVFLNRYRYIGISIGIGTYWYRLKVSVYHYHLYPLLTTGTYLLFTLAIILAETSNALNCLSCHTIYNRALSLRILICHQCLILLIEALLVHSMSKCIWTLLWEFLGKPSRTYCKNKDILMIIKMEGTEFKSFESRLN